MKICSSCKKEKDFSCFSVRKRAKDGLDYYCRDCKKEKSDPVKHSILNKNWRYNNKERDSKRRKIRRNENPESWSARYKDWASKNPHMIAERASRRRAVCKKATPSWASKRKIDEIYERAKILSNDTGILHHVDHIVPLKSDLVCGLHWEGNLQILPYYENIAKHNKVWPDMSEAA